MRAAAARDGIDQLQITPEEAETNQIQADVIRRKLGDSDNLKGENYEVAGVDGSSKAKTPREHGIRHCTTWMDYWKMMTNKSAPPAGCCIKMCPGDAECGLHVWVKGKHRGKRCHILPGCREHNDKYYDLHGGFHGGKTNWMVTHKTAILVPCPISDVVRSREKQGSSRANWRNSNRDSDSESLYLLGPF